MTKDLFKIAQLHHVGIGGLKCPCCNGYFGKSKVKLNRRARAKTKADTYNEVQSI